MKTCPYCGNNPIPHFTHKLYESFDILVSPIRRFVFQTRFGKLTDHLATWVAIGFFYLLKPVGLVQINRDINKIIYPRAKVLWEEAQRRGIVNPRAGSRGRHTTTFVYTKEDLIQAFKIAKQLCYWVIVEEHLFGDVQRGTVIGGKLVGVLGGSPPRVTGDGKSTIAELIKIKDLNRPSGVKETVVNPYFMERLGLAMQTILPEGKTVDLNEKVGVNYGGTSYDCTDETHPDTKQMLEEAGKVLDCSILGFDFIVPDITKSYKEQKAGIIECNGAPFIQLHHDPLIGNSINAAKYVWDLVE